jgi:hypothetical protein
MKKCLVLFVALILGCSTRAFSQAAFDQNAAKAATPYTAPDMPPSPPRHLKLNPNKPIIANSVIILPGQEIVFDNTTFFWVRMFSDLPISFRDGNCFRARTTDITCEIMPNIDVHVQDVRASVPDAPAPINRVRFTFMRHAPEP